VEADLVKDISAFLDFSEGRLVDILVDNVNAMPVTLKYVS
jgi:hypothetical protein